MTSVAHAGGGFGRSVLLSAMRGGVLIGLAVVIGVVLLQVVDDAGGSGGGGGGGNGSAATTPSSTATTQPGTATTRAGAATTTGRSATTTTKKGATTTTAKAAAARPHEQVRVQVLNGSGVTGAATQRTNDLKAKGYQTLPAGNAAAQRTGTGVQCKAGFEADALELVSVLQGIGDANAKSEAFPNPAPAGSDSLDCYVVLGK
jgi:hypothetical protein